MVGQFRCICFGQKELFAKIGELKVENEYLKRASRDFGARESGDSAKSPSQQDLNSAPV
jgi:hypothetical protein